MKNNIVEGIIIGVALMIIGWLARDVIKSKIIQVITHIKNCSKMEKNTVFLTPFPIVKSPKNYLYFLDDKKRTPHCVNCSTPPNLVPLKRIGKFSKKYVCLICNTKYKK